MELSTNSLVPSAKEDDEEPAPSRPPLLLRRSPLPLPSPATDVSLLHPMPPAWKTRTGLTGPGEMLCYWRPRRRVRIGRAAWRRELRGPRECGRGVRGSERDVQLRVCRLDSLAFGARTTKGRWSPVRDAVSAGVWESMDSWPTGSWQRARGPKQTLPAEKRAT